MTMIENEDAGIFERDVEEGGQQLEQTRSSMIIEWMFDRLAGNNASFTNYISKAAALPNTVAQKLIVIDESETVRQNFAKDQGVAKGFADKAMKLGQKIGSLGGYDPTAITRNGKTISVGKTIGGLAGRAIGTGLALTGSAIIATIESPFAAYYLLKGTAKRALGSVALMGNIIRIVAQKMEDSHIVRDQITKMNDAKISKYYDKVQLSEEYQDKLQQCALNIVNAKNSEAVEASLTEYKLFVEAIPPAEKEKLAKLDKAVKPLLEAKAKRLEMIQEKDTTKGFSRITHDNRLSKIPGVKEVRGHINKAKSAASAAKAVVTKPFKKKETGQQL